MRYRLWPALLLALLLLLLLIWAAGVATPRPVVGDEVTPTPAITVTVHLPLVTRAVISPAVVATHAITVPVTTVVALGSSGPDHAAAFAPDGSGVFGDVGGWISTGVSPQDYGDYYLYRSFLEVAVPAFEGRVVSATLHLIPCTAWDTLYPPLPPATVTLHLGAWTTPMTATEPAALWGAWAPEPVVGRLPTDYAVPCWEAGVILRDWVAWPLDAAVITPGGVLRLVVRDGEDHLDLRADHDRGNRWFYHPPAAAPAYLTLWVEDVP